MQPNTSPAQPYYYIQSINPSIERSILHVNSVGNVVVIADTPFLVNAPAVSCAKINNQFSARFWTNSEILFSLLK